jgi:hypothetical protein
MEKSGNAGGRQGLDAKKWSRNVSQGHGKKDNQFCNDDPWCKRDNSRGKAKGISQKRKDAGY